MMIVVEELLVMGGIVGLLVVFLVKGSPLSSWRRMRPVWGVVCALASVLGFVALTSDGPRFFGPSDEEHAADEKQRAADQKQRAADDAKKRADEDAKIANWPEALKRAAQRHKDGLAPIVAGYKKLTSKERLAQVAMNCPPKGKCDEDELLAILLSASSEDEKRALRTAINKAMEVHDE